MFCYFVHFKQNKLQSEIAKVDQVSKTGFLSLLRRGMWDYLFVSYAQEKYTILFHKAQFVLFCAILYVEMMFASEGPSVIFAQHSSIPLFRNYLSLVCTYAAKYSSSFCLKWRNGSYIPLWVLSLVTDFPFFS